MPVIPTRSRPHSVPPHHTPEAHLNIKAQAPLSSAYKLLLQAQNLSSGAFQCSKDAPISHLTL